MVHLLYGLAGSEASYSFYLIKLFIYVLFACVYATEDKTQDLKHVEQHSAIEPHPSPWL